jgi:hypothetical protein
LVKNLPVIGDVGPEQPAVVAVVPRETDFFFLLRPQRVVELLDEVLGFGLR